MKDEVQGRNDLRRSVLDALNAAAPALENLNTRQEQCDADGVMVKVSRQALDEVLSAVNQVAFQAAITPTPIADSSEAGTGGVAELLAAIRPHMIALSVTDDAAEYKSLVRRIDAALSAPLGEPVAWRYRREDGTDIPLGEQCREAAAEIERLRALLRRIDDVTAWETATSTPRRRARPTT
jgi:hypothetical protein